MATSDVIVSFRGDARVIVNDAQRDAYQARIRSVFQATHRIPHNIIDITASAHRRMRVRSPRWQTIQGARGETVNAGPV